MTTTTNDQTADLNVADRTFAVRLVVNPDKLRHLGTRAELC